MDPLDTTSVAAAGDSDGAEKRRKLDEAAKAARERRALKKAKKAARLATDKAKVAKAGVQVEGEASSVDQPATREADDRNGWPSDGVVAANTPAAASLIRQVLSPLQLTRYGAALEARKVAVPQPDGGTKDVEYDPVAVQLAPPVAALMFGGNGARPSPGWSLAIGAAVMFVPLAVAHAIEAVMESREKAAKRRDAAERAKLNQPSAPAPMPPPPAAVPRLVEKASGA